MVELHKHLGGHCGITHLETTALHYLRDKYNLETSYDLGCGVGGQVNIMRVLKMDCLGIDGDPSVSPDILHDFTTGQLDIQQRDFIWCCEFLEHVEECYMENYFSVLKKARYILCTASQSYNGHHHVNVKPLSYWIQAFQDRGFAFDENESLFIRANNNMGREFLRQTGMFFVNLSN